MESPTRTSRWIAQHDAVVMAKVVQFLSSPHGFEEHRLPINIEYVPYRFTQGKLDLKEEHLKQDLRHATEILKKLRAATRRTSSIMIGSQRVNHVVELMIADVFGCEPFRPPRKENVRIPFYLVYRKGDRAMPSCFGGRKPPPGQKTTGVPGIHYMTTDGWAVCPWKHGEQDAGIVLIVRDPSVGALEMAVFGFSGLGTEAIGDQLLMKPELFWSDHAKINGKQVGVYVCRFGFAPLTSDDEDEQLRTTEVEVTRLDGHIPSGNKRHTSKRTADRTKAGRNRTSKKARNTN